MALGRKTGGRKRGTPNRTTAEMRETLKAIIEDEMESLPALLSEMKPADRVNAIIRIIPFTVPKPPESLDVSLLSSSQQVNIQPIEWLSTLRDDETAPSNDQDEIGA